MAKERSYRVIFIFWKNRPAKPFEVYSNLKKFFDSNPDLPAAYNYKTIANRLTQDVAYDTEFIRIERLTVN